MKTLMKLFCSDFRFPRGDDGTKKAFGSGQLRMRLSRLSISAVLMLSISFSACSEEVECNYCERSYFGEYKIEKLSFSEFKGFPLLRYVGHRSGNKLIRVTGYYSTGELKFIDIIKDGRIEKTTYFSLQGEAVFQKQYDYRDGKVIRGPSATSSSSVPGRLLYEREL